MVVLRDPDLRLGVGRGLLWHTCSFLSSYGTVDLNNENATAIHHLHNLYGKIRIHICTWISRSSLTS